MPVLTTKELTVPKKILAVHFTLILWKPNTGSRHRESHILFVYSSLYSNNVVYTWLEVFYNFSVAVYEHC